MRYDLCRDLHLAPERVRDHARGLLRRGLLVARLLRRRRAAACPERHRHRKRRDRRQERPSPHFFSLPDDPKGLSLRIISVGTQARAPIAMERADLDGQAVKLAQERPGDHVGRGAARADAPAVERKHRVRVEIGQVGAACVDAITESPSLARPSHDPPSRAPCCQSRARSWARPSRSSARPARWRGR